MRAPWWRHQMKTFYALLALCAGNSLVTGEFPTQRPEPRRFDVFFDLRLNKQLSKQSRRRWFETPSRSLWHHCNAIHTDTYGLYSVNYAHGSHFVVVLSRLSLINILRPRQNGRHFADDIFKRIFLNENVWIPIEISLKLVPYGPINNIPAIVQIMAWRRSGDKPLCEPIMVN